MKDVCNFLSSPFNKNLRFFLVLFLLASSVNFIDRFSNIGLSSAIYWSLFGWAESYLLCLLIPLFKSRYATVYKTLLLAVGIINFITDVIIAKISSCEFNEFVGLILGTNASEITEFFAHYVSLTSVLLILGGAICLAVVYYLLGYVRSNKIITLAGFCILIGSLPMIFRDTYHHYENIFVGKIYTIINEYNKNDHQLEDFFADPSLTTTRRMPDNIVVVIGESFAKDFSSLYGYEKETNPRLSHLPDSSLVKYSNVTSADISTVENIECILSTFTLHTSDKQWYECLTLKEVMSKLGYKTYWVSNQAEIGLWDNIPAKYAHLCDSSVFVSNQTVDKGVTYDEEVIAPVREILTTDASRKIIFVHLIGSHPSFEQRYPRGRSVFATTQYQAFPENQREVRRHYDNSLVYNDSVVAEILTSGADKETLFFYFPDHGLDIYHTDTDYVGHAKRGEEASEEVAKHIPFMIYATPLYQHNYPAEMKRIRESTDNKFVTENFIYALMDIIGARFTDNDDVQKYTLFNKE